MYAVCRTSDARYSTWNNETFLLKLYPRIILLLVKHFPDWIRKYFEFWNIDPKMAFDRNETIIYLELRIWFINFEWVMLNAVKRIWILEESHAIYVMLLEDWLEKDTTKLCYIIIVSCNFNQTCPPKDGLHWTYMDQDPEYYNTNEIFGNVNLHCYHLCTPKGKVKVARFCIFKFYL